MNLNKRLTQLGMTAAVLAVVAGGMQASAAESGASAASPSPQASVSADAAAGKPAVVSVRTADGGLATNPVHMRHYWKLLAATYAPDLSDAWAEALAERKQLESELAGSDVRLHVDGTAERMPLPALDGKPFTIQVSEDGQVLRVDQSFTVRLQPSAEQPGGGEASAQRKAQAERQAKLTEAIEAEDEAAIRGLLPLMLEDYRAETERLKQELERYQAVSEQAGR